MLVFSVTPFKIDQNKNQNRSIDKAQNLGNDRRCICKDPRHISGQWDISYTRYWKKRFTQIYSGALVRAKRARSGAPWVRKFGKLSIRENLVMT